VEHLTHSQQKLDGSLAINTFVWSPSSQLNLLQPYIIKSECGELGSAKQDLGTIFRLYKSFA